MKQKIKRILLVLGVAVSLLSLSACAKKNASSEPVPRAAANLMIQGAVSYLEQFDSLSDAQIDVKMQRGRKLDDKVMYNAYQSWMTSKKDLGSLVKILSADVVRVSEDSYKVHVRASYEKRELDFYMTAVEQVSSDDSEVTTPTQLKPTELVFSPVFTTGEKLAKAGMNTLMGMGTVFIVLIFISFIISRFKNIRAWEDKLRGRKNQEQTQENTVTAPSAPAAVPSGTAAALPPAGRQPQAAPEQKAPVQAAPAQKASAVPAAGFVPGPAAVSPSPGLMPALGCGFESPGIEERNLADDLELVAVITAAISAAANVPAEGLVVRSIRRKPASRWKNA